MSRTPFPSRRPISSTKLLFLATFSIRPKNIRSGVDTTNKKFFNYSKPPLGKAGPREKWVKVVYRTETLRKHSSSAFFPAVLVQCALATFNKTKSFELLPERLWKLTKWQLNARDE